jgi:flagellar biosynthesis protein FlhG
MIPANEENNSMKTQHKCRTYALVSGKGGVGKTNTASNLAVTLAAMGKRVLLCDCDLGLSNVDTLLGLCPRRTAQHAVIGGCRLEDVLIPGPAGISILPAASGVPEMAELTDERMQTFCDDMRELSQRFDIVLLDAPSGIASTVRRVAALADELLILTTPEPTAVMDAYAVAKVFSAQSPELPMRLLVNMVSEQDNGQRIARGFAEVAARYLERNIETVGQMPFDPHVALAVRRQQAYALCYPHCVASKSLRQLAVELIRGTVADKWSATQNEWKNDLPVKIVNRLANWPDPHLG